MAGSYAHMTTDSGKLRNVGGFHGMLDTGGDVYEAAEECFGMVHWLAKQLESFTNIPRADWVSQAQANHAEGLRLGGVQKPR